MKRKWLIGILGASLVFGGALAVGAANNDSGNETTVKTESRKDMLRANEAGQIALEAVDGMLESIELEMKNGKTIYEVEIESHDDEYEVYLDAYTGEIYYIDRDDDRINTTNQYTGAIISQEDAIAIAEKTVNGKMKEIEREEDDGFLKYDVELRTDRGEAEVEVDAMTGKVLEIEWED